MPCRTGFPSLCGTLYHTLPRSVFEKAPLGTLKNFFRFVKAKPDGLSVFHAGTSSRLKRLGLFRSCRREASPKTQGLSEDASHHAREHKTPTEGTANGIHRPAPKNQQLRYSGFLTLPLKVRCLSAEKVFGSTPFSEGVAGLQGGSPAKSAEPQGVVLQETPTWEGEQASQNPEAPHRPKEKLLSSLFL